MQAINSNAASQLRYRGGIITCTIDGLNSLERKTKELPVRYEIVHPQCDIEKDWSLYI